MIHRQFGIEATIVKYSAK